MDDIIIFTSLCCKVLEIPMASDAMELDKLVCKHEHFSPHRYEQNFTQIMTASSPKYLYFALYISVM